MRVKTRDLLREKIEEGIRGGLNKAMKYNYVCVDPIGKELHDATQAYNAAVDTINQYIMNSICEYFSWDDEAVE
jgi:hypothetical protein